MALIQLETSNNVLLHKLEIITGSAVIFIILKGTLELIIHGDFAWWQIFTYDIIE